LDSQNAIWVIQFTQEGGVVPHGSADGAYLYYFTGTSYKNGGFGRVSTGGGEEEAILDESIVTDNWNFEDDRLYYAKNESGGGFSIHCLDVKTGKKTRVFRQEEQVGLSSLSVAPDESWIYYSSQESPQTADIMLVENFH